jgi:hypothetical protein
MRGHERIAGALFSLNLLFMASDAPAEKMADISISGLPSQLPPAVVDMVHFVVKVYRDGKADTGEYASGLQLSPNTILTTGHLFEKPTHCDSVVVDASTDDAHASLAPTQGTRRWAGTVQKRYDTVDAAIITLPKATVGSPVDKGVTPSIKIRDVAVEPMRKSEAVFALGLGQFALRNGESQQRDLYSTRFTPDQLREGYANPHVVGGAVLGLQTIIDGARASQRYVVRVGIEDYTQGEKDPEKRLHPGDSGSAVFDGLGRLIGIVAAVNPKSQFMRLPAGYVPLGFVQPVDRGVVEDLSKQPVEPCVPK